MGYEAIPFISYTFARVKLCDSYQQVSAVRYICAASPPPRHVALYVCGEHLSARIAADALPGSLSLFGASRHQFSAHALISPASRKTCTFHGLSAQIKRGTLMFVWFLPTDVPPHFIDGTVRIDRGAVPMEMGC